MFIEEFVLTNLKITRGHILAITREGKIIVQDETEGFELSCDFLRTSTAPPPQLTLGDAVLYARDETGMRGYILGLIEKYLPETGNPPDKFLLDGKSKSLQEIKIEAEEKIELRCGQSSITMNKEGKVVIKGANLTSRASRINKIKGGAVRIN